ncbi:hypothetical protein NARC_40075 [Candidatus Nitrosocosmicus arcticus]|uniref:Uncharacterized protein n=1 Tax=Candidatus Nitrosocosmicus arcticus TaxID=2035267 RepID=A0A557SWY9_9ARCH|nr:hypothetical protein NARC_40075 [Candidatus Nitrosocosmicus arcticus]
MIISIRLNWNAQSSIIYYESVKKSKIIDGSNENNGLGF